MKNKVVVAFFAIVIAATWLVSSPETAPITGGTFLVYDVSGTQMRLTFSPADGDRFATNIAYADDDGNFGTTEPSPAQRVVVDTHGRTADGAIFEVGMLGPLWIPPSEVHEGGSARGRPRRSTRGPPHRFGPAPGDRRATGAITDSVGDGRVDLRAPGDPWPRAQ